MNTNRKTITIAAAVALALVAATANAAQKQHTVTGSLIPLPLQTVVVQTPTMAMIRAIAIKPIVRPVADGRCEVIGAVYSDEAAVADGPMPHIKTALVGNDGQHIEVETGYRGIYRAVVPAGTWHEARPQVGELPFGVHPSRPRIECR